MLEAVDRVEVHVVLEDGAEVGAPDVENVEVPLLGGSVGERRPEGREGGDRSESLRVMYSEDLSESSGAESRLELVDLTPCRWA